MSVTPQEVALLKRRAALLARRAEAAGRAAGGDEVLVAQVGQARYAARLEALTSVVQLPRLTRIPQAPAFVAGLAPLHGRILTIVDLAALMGERDAAPPRFGLILEVAKEPFGLGVPQLVGLSPDLGQAGAALPDGIPEPARHLIDAVSPDGVCRLDLPRLIQSLLAVDLQGSTPT